MCSSSEGKAGTGGGGGLDEIQIIELYADGGGDTALIGRK